MILAAESDTTKGNGNLSQEAQASGMSVEQFLRFQQLQYENKRILQQQKEAARKELEAQAVQVRKIYFQELYKPVDGSKNDITSQVAPTVTNQAYILIFTNIYDKALSVLSAQALVCNAEFELLPAMFVVADYSCLSSNKNRQLIGNELRAFILFSQMTFEESLEYFSVIVKKMPGIASRIIRDGIRFGQHIKLPSENECGEMIQQCMQIKRHWKSI